MDGLTTEHVARLLARYDDPLTRWGELTGLQQDTYKRKARRLLDQSQDDYMLMAMRNAVRRPRGEG